ncbi:TIGR03905 family TSCPD domain-containing protein [Anoxybacter fermentans]|uniref:TIGR03905 family TSCPD domain-containing protein n=1 Tax=Anoxybacter fermentans TaxID=1323375 RepID=UPI001F017F82|nr:TIGR03905 family TSCPD domain-containing protein [Anoxybacter fermentans]
MERISYDTNGTCARHIIIELDGDVVSNVEFVGGCFGNLLGLSQLVKGQKIDDLIKKLKGIQCRNGTSCPDQFAQALETVKINR